jgi:hypothetical protein
MASGAPMRLCRLLLRLVALDLPAEDRHHVLTHGRASRGPREPAHETIYCRLLRRFAVARWTLALSSGSRFSTGIGLPVLSRSIPGCSTWRLFIEGECFFLRAIIPTLLLCGSGNSTAAPSHDEVGVGSA